jgi:hypothetical protein
MRQKYRNEKREKVKNPTAQAHDSLARISSMTNSISPPHNTSHGSHSPGMAHCKKKIRTVSYI